MKSCQLTIQEQIRLSLRQLASADKAGPMQAYMKTTQPFYGVQAKQRKELLRKIKEQFLPETPEELQSVVWSLWQGDYREEMYMALELIDAYPKMESIDSFSFYQELVHTAPHWDTLDWIAGGGVSRVFKRHKHLFSEIEKWITADGMWVRRASILAHLKHKEDTYLDLLAPTILRLAPEKEFFIRKAIGWVLRDLSYSKQDWVRNFVQQNDGKLAGLSKREALKHLKRKGTLTP